jgi:hypothetical protein
LAPRILSYDAAVNVAAPALIMNSLLFILFPSMYELRIRRRKKDYETDEINENF